MQGTGLRSRDADAFEKATRSPSPPTRASRRDAVRGGAHRFLEMNEQAAHFGDYRRSQEFAGENAPTFTRAESRFIVDQRVDQLRHRRHRPDRAYAPRLASHQAA